jgi:hypothetical protein
MTMKNVYTFCSIHISEKYIINMDVLFMFMNKALLLTTD